jgi:hypothetical protein
MNPIEKETIYFFFHTGGLSNDIDQLRTCHRCHRIFPVLSELFNHTCDDENDMFSSKSPSPSSKIDNKTTNDKISSISPESFKLNQHSIPSFTKHKLFSSPSSTSIHKTEHIPTFKRPLFQPDDKQYSSTAYINMRNPSSPIRVNS